MIIFASKLQPPSPDLPCRHGQTSRLLFFTSLPAQSAASPFSVSAGLRTPKRSPRIRRFVGLFAVLQLLVLAPNAWRQNKVQQKLQMPGGRRDKNNQSVPFQTVRPLRSLNIVESHSFGGVELAFIQRKVVCLIRKRTPRKSWMVVMVLVCPLEWT